MASQKTSAAPAVDESNLVTCYARTCGVTFLCDPSWKIKQDLWKVIGQKIPQDPCLSIVDSFPVPVCRFARAPRCPSFREVAAYGHDEVARQTYFGLRAHVRLAWPGIIVNCTLAPADIHDTEGALDVLENVFGFALAGYMLQNLELQKQE